MEQVCFFVGSLWSGDQYFFDILRNVCDYVGNIRVVLCYLGDTRKQRLASCVRGECGLEGALWKQERLPRT